MTETEPFEGPAYTLIDGPRLPQALQRSRSTTW